MGRLDAPDFESVSYPADLKHHWVGRLYPPVFIGLHATGGRNSRDWLTIAAKSEASAHFRVPKTGPVERLVKDTDAAWTNGPSTVNIRPGIHPNPNWGALTIEVENMDDGKDPYTEHQVVGTALICVRWWALYGYLPIIKHWLVQLNKHDPAGWPDRLFSEHLFRIVDEYYRP